MSRDFSAGASSFGLSSLASEGPVQIILSGRHVNQPKTFEEAMARLEEIVGQLEKGEIALEETLLLFEEGVKLSQFCRQKLDQAESRVEILLKDERGVWHPEPYPTDPEKESVS